MGKTYASILKKMVLPIADRAMKTSIASSYQKIKKMQTFTTAEIKAWQNKQLQQLIQHAYNHTKYYHKLFNNLGLLPNDIKAIDDLGKIPVLTKEIIRESFEDIMPDNLHSIPYKKSATGGSTGDPLPYLLDRQSWSFSNANKIYNWEKVGYRYGQKHIALGSTSLFVNQKSSYKHILYYALKSKIGLNGINMSDDVCASYIDFIKKKKIRFIYGYASAIYLLAKYVLKNNIKPDVKVCFPTSEVLTDIYRKTIYAAFQCEVIDCYGANDGGVTAFSHQPGFFEVGYNCIVRINNPDLHGIGPALLTDLLNYAMPFINYKIGDEYHIDESKNKKYSYNGQVINKILGRTSDIIQLENGATLTGPGFTILFKDLPIEHYFIEKDGINSIACSIVRLSGFTTQHEDIIKSTFIKQMGPNAHFTINYTNEIPLTKSGKRQYFKK